MFSADDVSISNVEDRLDKKDEALFDGGAEATELEWRIKAKGLREFFDLRKKWSSWIIFWISCLIIFNSGLAVFVGMGVLDFSEYEWFITAVTVETFLQVVGMGYVAVKFLFSDN